MLSIRNSLGNIRGAVHATTGGAIALVVAIGLGSQGGPALAGLGPADVTIVAPFAARRQESSLPAAAPTRVWVSVRGGPMGRVVSGAALAFDLRGASADHQYRVTAPALPVGVGPSDTVTLSFDVMPLARATLFRPVTLTATVTATEQGASTATNATTSTSWSVSPGGDLVLGQPDGFTVEGRRRGLNSPSSVFLGGTKLFAADTLNSRILIWNSVPTASGTVPDVVLGQPNLSSDEFDNGGVGPASLDFPEAVTSDGTRLIVSDSDNNRVLIWNSIPTVSGTPADVVLGQPDFTSEQENNGGLGAASLASPGRVATDGSRLFVSDFFNGRVLIWNSIPTANGTPADVVLGQPDFTSALQDAFFFFDFFEFFQDGALEPTDFILPSGIATDGIRLYVADLLNHRVLIWNSIPTANGTVPDLVLGQPGLESGGRNNGGRGPASLSSPLGVATDGTRLMVTDVGNRRVLVWERIPTESGTPADIALGQGDTLSRASGGTVSADTLGSPFGVHTDGTRVAVADRSDNRILLWNRFPRKSGTPADIVLGQPDFVSDDDNDRGTGRETLDEPEGVFFDGSRLIVSDTSDHRVLIWNDVPRSPNAPADVVLGQRDFDSSDRNRGEIGPDTFSDPTGVFSDGTRLFVADDRNHRVLIWNSIPTSSGTSADVVLGQPDFTSNRTDNGGIGPDTFDDPYRAFSDGTRLYVADNDNHRVLIWNSIPTSDRTSADVVVGQPDFTSSRRNNGGRGANTLNDPSDVFSDGTRLLVVDRFNRRVLIWNSIPTSDRTSADVVVGQSDFTKSERRDPLVSSFSAVTPFVTPFGVTVDGSRLFVSDSSGLVWVWDSIPAVSGTPADGVVGPPGSSQLPLEASVGQRFVVDPYSLPDPHGLFAGDGQLFVADSDLDRVVRFSLDEETFPAVKLTYSRDPLQLAAGGLTITATFDEPIVSTPTLAIEAPGTVNDLSATAMTPTATATVWTLDTTVAVGDDGTAVVTVGEARNADGNESQRATGGTLRINTQGPVTTLTFSRQASNLPSGGLRITATFDEALSTTPTVSIAAPGTDNDRGPAELVPTTDPTVWTFETTLVGGAQNDGDGLVTVEGAVDLLGQAGAQTTSPIRINTTGPTVALTYSRERSAIGTGALRVTATFSTATVITPTAAVEAPGTRNDRGPTAMAPTGDGAVWTLDTVIQGGADGAARLVLGTENGNQPPSNDGFTIDTTGPEVVLGYSRAPDEVTAGSLTITATFSEPVRSTPTISLDASGDANDVSAASMAATTDERTWTRTVVLDNGPGLQGEGRITVASGGDRAGNSNQPARNDRIEILSRALPVVTDVVARPKNARQGSSFDVFVRVANLGQSDATDLAFELVFRGPGGEDLQDSFTVAASEFNPGSLPGFETADLSFPFEFAVMVGADAPPGPVSVNAVVSGLDAPSGASVGDADGATSPARFTVVPVDRDPTARIAPQLPDGGPRVISLDGAPSTATTTDGVLNYAWTLMSRPVKARLFASSAGTTSFRATVPGTYAFVLTVFDSQLRTDSATLTVSVQNAPPAADGGGDRRLILTRPDATFSFRTSLDLELDGTASTDPNGDSLTYSWQVLRAPDLSEGATGTSTLVSLGTTATARTTATFTPSRTGGDGSLLAAAGSYVFRLTVSDGTLTGTADVTVEAVDPSNLQPTADAGLDRSVEIQRLPGGGLAATIPDIAGSPPGVPAPFVRLDGRESADPVSRALTYSWTLADRPLRSTHATLAASESAFPRFLPDVEGPYTFRLIVDNGLISSPPDEVTIFVQSTNKLPTALAAAEDQARGRRSTPTNPVLVFRIGPRIVLDGSSSTDGDLADRGALSYRWTQTAGPAVSLEPSTTAPMVSFASVEPGLMQFLLTVTDPAGAADAAPVEVAVLPDGAGEEARLLPSLSIVSTATGTTATGSDLPAGIRLGRSGSLRVTLPAQVTLTATLRTTAPSSQTYDYQWLQVQGPTVRLASGGAAGTPSRLSVTSFTPTTSRVHGFELRVFPLNDDGTRSGFVVTRHVNVLVDSATAAVPVAEMTATPRTIALTGTVQDRTILLDGSSSRALQTLSGDFQNLTYLWRQIGGPRGTIENPAAAITTFVAPEFPGLGTSHEYIFELTVDATPPGDRSEPFAVQVQQGAGGSGTGSSSAFPRVGGGCALAGASAGGVALPLPLILLLAFVEVRRRRR